MTQDREELLERLGPHWRSMTYEDFSALNIQGLFVADRRHGEVRVWLLGESRDAALQPTPDAEPS